MAVASPLHTVEYAARRHNTSTGPAYGQTARRPLLSPVVTGSESPAGSGVVRRYEKHLDSDVAEATAAVVCLLLTVAAVWLSRSSQWWWLPHLAALVTAWWYPSSGTPRPKAPRRPPRLVRLLPAVSALVGVAAIWLAQDWVAAAGGAMLGFCTALTWLLAVRRIWPPDHLAYGEPHSDIWHSPTERRRGFERAAIHAFTTLRRHGPETDDARVPGFVRRAAERGLVLDGDRLRDEPRRLVVHAAAASALAAWRAGCVSWWEHEGSPAT